MTRKILLCTVGGSHQPILEAIGSNSPGHTCFFCTGNDPETGKSGSINQVIGSGLVVKAPPNDKTPSLPNIPTQADIDTSQFETCIVPADDLYEAFIIMCDTVSRLARQSPDARFIADYTGGTKTMTAALVCAALERDDVDLQLVTGARPNLISVETGTEQAMIVSVARLRFDRAMKLYLGAWQRFAWHEAAEGLQSLRIATNSPDRVRLGVARAISRALARWDDFDHAGALDLLVTYAARVARVWPTMLPALRILTHEGDQQQDPARLFDLWWNAERCASQGRFDDAVARVYRLIEWTAQWQLRSKLDIDTGNVPSELLPEGIDVRPDHDGKMKAGLWQAWQIVAAKVDGPARELIAGETGRALHDLLAIRNRSILAHGFLPVQQSDWKRIQRWMEHHFLPILGVLGKEVGLRQPPRQLPHELPDSVFET